MDALKFPPALRRGQNSNPPACSHTGRALCFQAHHSQSPFFTLLFTLIKATLPPTFKIDPGSYVASVGSTIAPTRVLNFPSDSKKKGRPSRPLDYCLGKPEISGAPKPPSSPLRVTTARKHPQHHFQHFNTFPKYYLLIPDRPFRYFLTFHSPSTQP